MARQARRKPSIDPAVADLLKQDQHRQEQRAAPLAERQRRHKEREKARARNRKMLDLPVALTDILTDLAERYRCPESQIAALLMVQGLEDLLSGKLDVFSFRIPSRSPRYDFNLVIEVPEL
jgi:hypothetical protein